MKGAHLGRRRVDRVLCPEPASAANPFPTRPRRGLASGGRVNAGPGRWPANRRLAAPRGAQPSLQESAPFYGADSWGRTVKTYSAFPVSGCVMSGLSSAGTRRGLPPPRPVGTATNCLPPAP